MRRRGCRLRPLPAGHLERCLAFTWLVIHSAVAWDRASVAACVMYEREVTRRCSPATSLPHGAERCRRLGVLVRYLVALSPAMSRETQRAITLLSLVWMRLHTSIAAIAKRRQGPRASGRSLSVADVESTKSV